MSSDEDQITLNLDQGMSSSSMSQARALFDMAAVAIVKNPLWATPTKIPSPKLVDGKWIDQPNNLRSIIVWENFKKNKIMNDFYSIMENYVLINLLQIYISFSGIYR